MRYSPVERLLWQWVDMIQDGVGDSAVADVLWVNVIFSAATKSESKLISYLLQDRTPKGNKLKIVLIGRLAI